MADLAWSDVDTTTIRNCWRKAGILPDVESSSASQPSIPISSLLHDSSAQMDPIANAERQVEVALDNLVATGALQKTNRMYIESLLNPVGESHVLTGTSDDEICQAVLEAMDARENMIMNGGDDVDTDIPMEPRPSRRDVLKAASTIGRYIDDWNNHTARKLEALLGSFNRQLTLDETNGMKTAMITDFFHRE